MAKITNPLFSLNAHGAIARRITFNSHGKNHSAKKWHQPSGAASTAQNTRRTSYRDGCAAWQNLSPAEKEAYGVQGQAIGLNGFQVFMREWLLTHAAPSQSVWDGGASTWDGGATTWPLPE